MDDGNIPPNDPVTQAKNDGFLVRSGHPIQVYREYFDWCRANHRPFIVGIRLARDAVIELDGRETWRGPVEELTTHITALARTHHQPDLFT
jgi:hypothetical protein